MPYPGEGGRDGDTEDRVWGGGKEGEEKGERRQDGERRGGGVEGGGGAEEREERWGDGA